MEGLLHFADRRKQRGEWHGLFDDPGHAKLPKPFPMIRSHRRCVNNEPAVVTGVSSLLNQTVTIQAGHSNVRYDQLILVRSRANHGHSPKTVRSGIDGVARHRKPLRQARQQLEVVFDVKNSIISAQGRSPHPTLQRPLAVATGRVYQHRFTLPPRDRANAATSATTPRSSSAG